MQRLGRSLPELGMSLQSPGMQPPRVVTVGAEGRDGGCNASGGHLRDPKTQVRRVRIATIQNVQEFSAIPEGLPGGAGARMRPQEVRDEEGAAFQVRDVRSCP